MNAVIEWYQALSERDQKIFNIAVPIVAVLILIFGVVLPVNSMVSEKSQAVVDTKSAIVLLQNMAPQNRGSSGKQSYSSLTNVITNTTRSQGFKLNRFEEKKNGEINVWFDQVNFDQMLVWLASLENQYGITTSYISVSQTNEAGIVRANVRLISG